MVYRRLDKPLSPVRSWSELPSITIDLFLATGLQTQRIKISVSGIRCCSIRHRSANYNSSLVQLKNAVLTNRRSTDRSRQELPCMPHTTTHGLGAEITNLGFVIVQLYLVVPNIM